MDYNETILFLNSLLDRERVEKVKYPETLDDFRKFLKRMGNPEKGLKTIHIAGTKGKGSTASIISEILRNAGYKTGLFLSPHLLNIRERIQLNGLPIPEEAFARIITKIKPEIKNNKGFRSLFETITSASFIYFKEKNADIAVYEVGLGGRLDATNVIETPDVAVITSISFDHTHILGNTLRKIAREKAGIIKKGGSVVSTVQDIEAEKVIQKIAREKEAKLSILGKDAPFEPLTTSLQGTKFLYKNQVYHTSLLGIHQAENTALSIFALEHTKFSINKTITKDTLKNITIPGRFQILRKTPYLVIDGAHNVESAKYLADAVEKIFGSKVLLIYASMKRKDVVGILKALRPVIKKIIITHINIPRAKPEEEIQDIAHQLKIPSIIKKNPIDALSYTFKISRKDDIILAAGSLYLAGEILKNANNWGNNGNSRVK